MNSFIICNVKIVTPYYILDKGFVYVKRGIIEGIGQTSPSRVHRSCNMIDGFGSWLIPGIIDLYNDSFERAYKQSDKALHSIEDAFFSLEKRLIIQGVTSVHHFLNTSADEVIDELKRLKKFGFIRHNINPGKRFNSNFIIISASGIIEEAVFSLNSNINDLIDNNNEHIICSDYESKSIIQSIFTLNRLMGLNLVEAVKMATLNPAIATCSDKKLGSIEYGKNADFIVINSTNETPEVEMVFVSGCKIYDKNTSFSRKAKCL